MIQHRTHCTLGGIHLYLLIALLTISGIKSEHQIVVAVPPTTPLVPFVLMYQPVVAHAISQLKSTFVDMTLEAVNHV
jgi:uncharacterized membrane protein YjjB (DUF3815 family)